MRIDRDLLAGGARELGIALGPEQVSRFERLAALLRTWNERINLTRIPPHEVVPLLFLDSLTVLTVLDALAARRGSPFSGPLLDLGTGAGFPGLPIKIARPSLEVVLLDATRKKLEFVDTALRELGLEGASTLHMRAEEAGARPPWRDRHGVVAAKAVARLPTLAGVMLPLVRPGGVAIALKGPRVDEPGGELAAAMAAIERCGGRLLEVAAVDLPGTDMTRRLVVIEKIAEKSASPGKPAARRSRRRSGERRSGTARHRRKRAATSGGTGR